ncbi:telomerase reverse transcriptase 1 protein Trt1 [Schizosaccharomyces japonicus yFS275]|uniref:Telomerase reverse transcriptase n=1 Tax=Schizosaccharomyces japonicus (strain yFS275 / FY16936) TaxID=402676 RepID=T0T6J8_SCHJY|nr:telomerase reverse transcriptase 1 protein Trt1 [Schizosaccharomyces japonicus yFS275]EQC53054.1 telomerase reverse transcriptase 1 protein Trt1 [Schizosaccharomyces japonicus yFS275]
MGEAMMSYLLTFGSIYVHLPGKNYVQLCGVPLCDVPVLSRTEDVRKKRKTRPWPDAPKSQKKPNSRESISKKVSIRQILFTMNPTNSSPNYSVGFDKNYPLSISRPRPLHKRSLYVLCLMFPKQIPSSHESSGSIKGKTDSQHSSFSDFVIPKRLNSAYSMIRQLLKRYDKTSYQELYQYYCPFPKDAIAKREASTSITDFSVGSHQVYAFVKAVLKRVIPKNFWGSTANFQHLLKAVKFFINLRRYDVLNLDHVLLDIKIKDIRWLELPSTKGCRMSLTDFNKRKEIFAEFVHWLFSSFVMNLLQTSFYATESSGQRNKIYFFRRDVFHDLSEPFCHDIRNRLFEPVDANELDEKLHVASIRLLPKRNTFRLIVNLSRKLQLKESFTKETTFRSSSTNTMLLPLATILGWKTKLLSKKEAVYTTLADVYTELINYKARLSRVDMMNCKKYFVKVDIRNCYDCIDQKKLLRIVRTLFDEDEFLIRKYAIVRACYENFVKKYALSACTYADYLNFFQFAMQFKGRRDCQVFIDNVDSQTRTTDELMLLLKQHITQHTVSFGNGCYRQTQGIPQGSKISNTLCFFYTRDLVRKRLRFVNKGNSVLLRVVDDFLFITTRKRDAKRFLSLMVKGFPDYNFYVNEDKTMVNFDPGPKYLNKIKIASDELLFCGFRVNLRDLSIGRELYIQSSAHRRIITVEHASCIWQVLCKRLMGTVFSSLHPIFLNASHNSPSAIRYNVYTVAHNTAFRLRQYIHEYKLLPINVHDIVSKVWFVLSTRFRVYSLGVVNSSKPESLQFTSAEMKWLIIQGALDALRPVKQLAAFTLSLSREQKRLEKKIPVMYLRQCVSSRRFRAINLR